MVNKNSKLCSTLHNLQEFHFPELWKYPHLNEETFEIPLPWLNSKIQLKDLTGQNNAFVYFEWKSQIWKMCTLLKGTLSLFWLFLQKKAKINIKNCYNFPIHAFTKLNFSLMLVDLCSTYNKKLKDFLEVLFLVFFTKICLCFHHL